MAGSVPIVAYEGGGVNSIVTPETGVLTKRSSKALGEAVRKLLLNEKRRYAMTRNCRERAIEFYSTEVLGPRLNQWLLMILNE
jgi:glycosyltransferase involved in cell wall biosynthesis